MGGGLRSRHILSKLYKCFYQNNTNNLEFCCSQFLAAPSSSTCLVVCPSVRWSSSLLVLQSKTFVKKRPLMYNIVTKTYQNLLTYVTIEAVVTQNCFHQKPFTQNNFFTENFFFTNNIFPTKKNVLPNKKTIHQKKIVKISFYQQLFFHKNTCFSMFHSEILALLNFNKK